MVAHHQAGYALRAAGADDAPHVAALVGELLEEIMRVSATPAFTFERQATQARARAYIESGVYAVFIAVDTATHLPIGLATLCQSHALYAAGAFGIVQEFYVRPAYRGRGVGALLIEAAKRHALACGWLRLEVATPPLPAFKRTLSFYEAHGFSSTEGRKLKLSLSAGRIGGTIG